MKQCKNRKCWANSKIHALGCILNHITGDDCDGVSPPPSESERLTQKITDLERQIVELKEWHKAGLESAVIASGEISGLKKKVIELTEFLDLCTVDVNDLNDLTDWSENERDKLRTALEVSEARLAVLEPFVDKCVEPLSRNHQIDYACLDCIPHGTAIVKGFKCVYHEAKQLQASRADKAEVCENEIICSYCGWEHTPATNPQPNEECQCGKPIKEG